MFKKIYTVIGTLLIGAYATSALMGWELTSTARQTVPSSVRQSPGGYRSFHFWHSSYRGGK